MSNFKSLDVKVFPTEFRSFDLKGKYTSEHNFVNILNSLTDIDSYVLNNDNNVLKVVIHGYYFEISNFNPSSTDLWLGIKVESGDNSLVNYDDGSTTLDSGDNFVGLLATEVSPTDKSNDNYSCYYLKVVENGKIINKVRLVTDSIKYSTGKNLTEELNSKQYIVSNGDGIDVLDNNDPSKRVIKLTAKEFAKLSSMYGLGGTEGERLFFTDSSGVMHNSTNLDIGSRDNETEGVISSQSTYVSRGVITGGQTFYASKGNPSGGQVGDIWFKYTD